MLLNYIISSWWIPANYWAIFFSVAAPSVVLNKHMIVWYQWNYLEWYGWNGAIPNDNKPQHTWTISIFLGMYWGIAPDFKLKKSLELWFDNGSNLYTTNSALYVIVWVNRHFSAEVAFADCGEIHCSKIALMKICCSPQKCEGPP